MSISFRFDSPNVALSTRARTLLTEVNNLRGLIDDQTFCHACVADRIISHMIHIFDCAEGWAHDIYVAMGRKFDYSSIDPTIDLADYADQCDEHRWDQLTAWMIEDSTLSGNVKRRTEVSYDVLIADVNEMCWWTMISHVGNEDQSLRKCLAASIVRLAETATLYVSFLDMIGPVNHGPKPCYESEMEESSDDDGNNGEG